MLDASGLGYWRHDVASGRLECSSRFKENLGIDPRSDVSSFAELETYVHPAEREPLRRAIEAATVSGEGFDIELRVGRGDRIRWVLSRVRVFDSCDGGRILAGFMLDLTEQKRADDERERLVAELAAERARLQALLGHLPATVVMADRSGRVVVSNQVERVFRSCAPSQDISDIYREWRVFDAEGRELAAHERPFMRAFSGETVSLQDIRYIHDDAESEGWMRISSAPIRDETGAVSGAVLIAFDVDREKRAEEALRASERRVRQLFDSPVIGIFQSRLDGRLVDANDTLVEMLGFSRDDLREGRLNWKELTAPELRAADGPKVDELLTTRSIRHYEKEFVRKDGSRIPVLIGCTLLDGSESEIATFVLDMSERKRAEREREALLRSLELAEERYRLAALATEDVIYDWDLRCNRIGVQTMFGQPHAYVYDMQSWMRLIHPDDRAGVMSLFRATIARRDPHWHAEYRFAKGDGTWLLIADRGYIAFDAAGSALRLVGALRDITLQRRRQEFERQLIGIVSHDLRNPLNTIALAADMLIKSAGLGERSLRNVLRIQRASERATRMIHDLLDFTRARLGAGIPIERRRTDLGAVFRGIVDDTRVGHPDRRIDFHASGDLTGAFDGDRLAQVLTNLLENALKYAPPGSPVRVTTDGTAHEVTLAVQNGGPPIAAELLPRIFEPLQRGDGSFDPSSRSVGLGLYIVKHLVEAHGGRVAIRSSERAGTELCVQLPRTPPG